MKYLLSIIFCCFSIFAFSKDSTKYVIVRVINIDSTVKKEIYNRAKIWVAKRFVSAKDIVQFDDNENNRIFVKAIKHYIRESVSLLKCGAMFTFQWI